MRRATHVSCGGGGWPGGDIERDASGGDVAKRDTPPVLMVRGMRVVPVWVSTSVALACEWR
jgi:hypothetical protein